VFDSCFFDQYYKSNVQSLIFEKFSAHWIRVFARVASFKNSMYQDRFSILFNDPHFFDSLIYPSVTDLDQDVMDVSDDEFTEIQRDLGCHPDMEREKIDISNSLRYMGVEVSFPVLINPYDIPLDAYDAEFMKIVNDPVIDIRKLKFSPFIDPKYFYRKFCVNRSLLLRAAKIAQENNHAEEFRQMFSLDSFPIANLNLNYDLPIPKCSLGVISYCSGTTFDVKKALDSFEKIIRSDTRAFFINLCLNSTGDVSYLQLSVGFETILVDYVSLVLQKSKKSISYFKQVLNGLFLDCSILKIGFKLRDDLQSLITMGFSHCFNCIDLKSYYARRYNYYYPDLYGVLAFEFGFNFNLFGDPPDNMSSPICWQLLYKLVLDVRCFCLLYKKMLKLGSYSHSGIHFDAIVHFGLFSLSLSHSPVLDSLRIRKMCNDPH